MHHRPHHPVAPSARRAMTLLELLLALTILASLTILVAAMWSQARRWGDDATSGHRLLRLQRLSELMRVQWSDRRTMIQLGDSADSVGISPNQLTFVTTTAVLFPEWPLVVASYRIEEDPSALAVGQRRYDLVYTETRVAELENAPEPPGADSSLDDRVARRRVVLKGATDLRWQRYGREDPDDKPADAPGKTATPASTRGSGPVARADRRPQQQPATPDVPDAEKPGDPEDDRLIARWRDMPVESRLPQDDPTPAVRLIGTYQQEDFACVFVIGASRS